MFLKFESPSDGPGIEIVDAIERRRLTIRTPNPPSLRSVPVEEAGFRFPVDGAVAATTDRVTVEEAPDVYVRDQDGATVASVAPGTSERIDRGTVEVELNASVKLYLRAPAPLSVRSEPDRVEVALDGEREVTVGARSYHRRPAIAVETTDDPVDVMRAVSLFGSALKTTSCERSYPTLRGHPPAVRRGERLSIPDGLPTPETGVELELPATLEMAYVAAPLAYYLGAAVVPGDAPRLVTDRGFVHELDTDRGVEGEIERVLKQVFFLDCLVRTEGHYRIDLHERAAVEPALDLDLAALYGDPLAEQVAAYLAVPYGVVRPHLPRWHLAAHLPPTPDRVEALPYLVDDLAVVRPARGRELSGSEVRSTVLRQYVDGAGKRDAGKRDVRKRGADGGLRSSESSDGRTGTHYGGPVVRPEPVDAQEQVWFGEGIPLDGTKGIARAFENRLDRTPSRDGIDITVVGNDALGRGERDVAGDVYGTREELPFDVTLRRDVPVAELARILESDADFLHYVGHIDDDGFHCPDGTLSVDSLDAVGVDAFFLNACRSYREGVRLVELGSVGGVVTFSDVVDDAATTIGRAMARLLNLGFPLHAALETARGESVAGGQYLVVGDGTVDVVQAEHGGPLVCEVSRLDDGDYELTPRTYLPSEGGMGGHAYPYLDSNEEHFLPPGRLSTFRVSEAELTEFLSWYRDPVERDGELVWNDSLGAPDL